MKKLSLHVQKEFCDECSLALRRFIGKMDGVNSIDTESGKGMICCWKALLANSVIKGRTSVYENTCSRL